MKKILFIGILLTLNLSYGQAEIKKDNISSAGGSATVGNTTVIFTVGEVAVQENTQGNMHLSEGFIGPDLTALGIEEFAEMQDVKIFPNPVENDLNILFSTEANTEIYLFDLTGKQVFYSQTKDESNTVLQLKDLPAAVYMLIIIDRYQQKRKILKVQKN